MAHSEIYEDGSEKHKFFQVVNADYAKRFGDLSQEAFANGAVAVKQQLIADNDECTCGSGVRFDLCCKPTKMP